MEAVLGDNVSPVNCTKVEGSLLCGFLSKMGIYSGHHGKFLPASLPISNQRLKSRKERQGLKVTPG